LFGTLHGVAKIVANQNVRRNVVALHAHVQLAANAHVVTNVNANHAQARNKCLRIKE